MVRLPVRVELLRFESARGKKKNLEELRVAKKKKLEELRAVLQTFLENRASALGVSARKVAAKLVRSCYVILVRPTVPKHTITFLHTLGRISCKLQVVCITCNLHVIHVKNFSLHVRARSRLYRNQILQENMRWKALAKIYTMHSFAPFSTVKFCLKNRQHFQHFRTKKLSLEDGAKECIVKILARAFQRIFSCKIWLPYSRERALSS